MISGPTLPNNLFIGLRDGGIPASSMIALNSTHFLIACFHDKNLTLPNQNPYKDFTAILSWPNFKLTHLPSMHFEELPGLKSLRCVTAIGFGKLTNSKLIYNACCIQVNPHYQFTLTLLSYDIEKGMGEEWSVIFVREIPEDFIVGKKEL